MTNIRKRSDNMKVYRTFEIISTYECDEHKWSILSPWQRICMSWTVTFHFHFLCYYCSPCNMIVHAKSLPFNAKIFRSLRRRDRQNAQIFFLYIILLSLHLSHSFVSFVRDEESNKLVQAQTFVHMPFITWPKRSNTKTHAYWRTHTIEHHHTVTPIHSQNGFHFYSRERSAFNVTCSFSDAGSVV